MIKTEDKNKNRKFRHDRMRFTIKGTAEKPRLNVYKSLSNIYVQIIDDTANDGNGATLVSESTLSKDLAKKVAKLTKTEAAKEVGKAVAKKAVAKGIKAVVFDRGGYHYTGRVAAVADGAREAGLEF